jgi:creatinine amidohydrolase
MRPFVLSETNWKTVKGQQYDLAILPWGATEAHNYHLPFSTDNLETERIAIESARLAWDQKARVIVLPTIPFGVNTGQKDITLTINLNPSTQAIILKDIVESLIHQKIYKFLIMNGHGGNDFRQMIRELGYQYPQMFISTCNWYMTVEKNKIFENGGDHADEMETSLMLLLAPALVLPLEEAGDGNFKRFRISAFNEDWAWAERKWSSVTADTGIGNPKKASKEKGERYFKEVTEKISELMIALAKANPDDLYQ